MIKRKGLGTVQHITVRLKAVQDLKYSSTLTRATVIAENETKKRNELNRERDI